MRQIRIAIALTTFLLVSFCIAQQTANNASATAMQNGSQAPSTGVLGGGGTTNFIPIWQSPNFLSNSAIYQASGGNIGIWTTTPGARLDVNGDINAARTYRIHSYSVLSIGSADEGAVFLGPGAGTNNVAGQGVDNTFLGQNSGYSNTTGDRNTFTGLGSGFVNTTGRFNTFTGEDAGFSNTTGDRNTFTGRSAGSNNTTGSDNTFYGWQAGYLNTTGSSDIYIGNQGPAPGAESNAIRIGDPAHQNAAYVAGIYGSSASGGVPVYVNSAGQLGTSPSSLRFKELVRDMGDSTSALMKLRPVTFFYKSEYDKWQRTLQYGLIAEEVAKVYPELVAYDNDGQPYSVRYQYLASMLLNEVQKQYHRVQRQSEVMETQQQEIKSQQQEIERLKLQLQQQNAALQLQSASLEEHLTKLESYVEMQMKTASDVQPAIASANGGLYRNRGGAP
jgi:hypothetical protein